MAAGEPFNFGVVRRLPHDIEFRLDAESAYRTTPAWARNQYPVSAFNALRSPRTPLQQFFQKTQPCREVESRQGASHYRC